MKKNDIEDLFKKSFENFEAEVNPSVWSNIQAGLKGIGLGLLGKAILNKIGTNTVVAVVSSAAAVIGTVVVMNWGSSSADKNQASTKTNTVVPKTLVENVKPNEKTNIISINAEEDKKNAIDKTITKKEKNKELRPTSSKTKISEEKFEKGKIESVIHTYSEEPIASISASPIGGTVPLIVNLTNIGTGNVNKWTFGDNKKESGTSNPVHVYETPGLYTIKLTSRNAEGKTEVDSIKIEVTGNSSISSIPTLFSPNDDGVNDVFVFQSKNIVNMSAVIFDKKGSIVYTWEGIDGKWDGKNQKGEKAKEGIYFYIISAEGVDGKKYEQKGSINLAR